MTSLSLFTFMHWRRKWQPTPVFLPGESQGRGSLVGCRLWGHTGSDTTEEQQAPLSSTISQNLLRFMSTESVMLSNRLILCLPLLLLPSILASIRVLSSELALCITWPWYWSFSISPSDEYSGQTLPPKFIFPSSALPQTFIRISVELSVSFCNVCIFCPHWVWLVLFLRTSTMIH